MTHAGTFLIWTEYDKRNAESESVAASVMTLFKASDPDK